MKRGSKLLLRAASIFVLLQLAPAFATAGDPEFHLLVDRMAAYCQKRPMRGMGFISYLANRFTPHGIGRLQLAVFDGISSNRRASAEEMEASLRSLVGPDYQTFVRARDNRSGDVSFIYVRESGKQWFDMLIVALDSTGAVVMKMRLTPDALRDWVDEPVHHGRHSSQNGGASAAP